MPETLSTFLQLSNSFLIYAPFSLTSAKSWSSIRSIIVKAPAAQIGLPPNVEPCVWSVSACWQESANIVAANGKPLKFAPRANSKEVIKADLVLLAMGFTGVPTDHPVVRQLALAQTPRTALVSAPERNVFCVGDCASGASLVVRALASGKALPL